MKVLHIITSLCMGGAEKLMVDLLPRFKNDGMDVDLLLLDGTETPFKRQLQEAGIKIFELGRGSVYNPLHIIRIIPYLRKYDIVHTHNFTAQLFAAIGSVECSVVLVTTEHSTSNRRRDWTWYRPIDRWMYNRYRKIICISDKVEDNLRKHLGDPKADIVTIYNGVNTSAYMVAESSSDVSAVSGNCKNLMMVAGFRHQKDQKTVIKAISLLSEDYHIYFVGDGPSRSECESLAEDLDVMGRVHFLGLRTDIASLLHAADAVIMSSHWEGFGLAAVEGMAAHKPVIASSVSGLREVVEGAGILFEKGNAQDLALKVQQLFSDPNEFQEIADKCQCRALEYDISKMVKGYEKVYAELAYK